jgi:hypothetical protein
MQYLARRGWMVLANGSSGADWELTGSEPRERSRITNAGLAQRVKVSSVLQLIRLPH